MNNFIKNSIVLLLLFVTSGYDQTEYDSFAPNDQTVEVAVGFGGILFAEAKVTCLPADNIYYELTAGTAIIANALNIGGGYQFYRINNSNIDIRVGGTYTLGFLTFSRDNNIFNGITITAESIFMEQSKINLFASIGEIMVLGNPSWLENNSRFYPNLHVGLIFKIAKP